MTADQRADIIILACTAFVLIVAGRFLFTRPSRRKGTVLEFFVALLFIVVVVLIFLKGGIPTW